jgi:hypothetical protein
MVKKLLLTFFFMPADALLWQENAPPACAKPLRRRQGEEVTKIKSTIWYDRALLKSPSHIILFREHEGLGEDGVVGK